MTIAITGGAGFIGTQLCHLLRAAGADFKILDIKPSSDFPEESCIVDICDPAALTEALAGCDMIYHLAAEHRDDVSPVSRYYSVNVDGARHIIAAAQKHNIQKIIFTSSVAVYGLNAGESSEDSVPNPFNDYGQSKMDSEKVFESWAAADTARTLVMIRLVATFGIGNRGNIYNLISQVARGKFMMVGNGKNCKSLAYVGNIAAFLDYAQKLPAGVQVYNYVDKPDYNMNILISEIKTACGQKSGGIRLPYIIGVMGGICFDVLAKITGRKFPISLIRVQKFCADTVVNGDKVHSCGFKAPYTMASGLQETIRAEFL